MNSISQAILISIWGAETHPLLRLGEQHALAIMDQAPDELGDMGQAMALVIQGLMHTRQPNRIVTMLQDRGITADSARTLVACGCLLLESLGRGDTAQSMLQHLLDNGANEDLALAAVGALQAVYEHQSDAGDTDTA